MAKKSNRKVHKVHRVQVPAEFREAVAYMQGVADAVGASLAPADDSESRARARSPSHRPTIRYGEEPPTVAATPSARRQTVPYASSGPAELAAPEVTLSEATELALNEDVLERPSGIRLRCAPLREEWYELAGATGEQRRK